jgi:hypothetical protein
MEPNAEVTNYLVINRVQVIDRVSCGTCGHHFTADPIGEKALLLSLGNAQRTYFFCGNCGDNIVGRVESEDVRKRYVWDWAVPLRNGRG